MIKEEYYKPHLCPVCGKFEFPVHGSYDICDVCGWEDDPVQEEDPEFGGANWEGLKGYRALYKAGMHEATNEEKRKWLKENRIYESNEDSEDRFDDEEEKNSGGNGGGNGGGHGNTRLPFGLCQRLGIEIGKDWSPSDAWDALAEKGVTPSGTYERLKKERAGSRSTGGEKKSSFTKESASEYLGKIKEQEKQRKQDIEKAKNDLMIASANKRSFGKACEGLTNEIQRMEANLKDGTYSESSVERIKGIIAFNYERLEREKENFEGAKKDERELQERLSKLESESPSRDKERINEALKAKYPNGWESCDSADDAVEMAQFMGMADESQKGIADITESLRTGYKAKYVKPDKMDSVPEEDEIIGKLAGGDETKGSCATLCIAYIANKMGFDVRDFRGGASQYAFSIECKKIMKELGAEVEVGRDGFKVALKNLAKVEEGKEYVFESGRHASIVRKKNGKIEYLEMQSSHPGFGWFPMTERVLKERFATRHSRTSYGHRFDLSSSIIEVSKAIESPILPAVFGFLNTEEGKEKKGRFGYAK